MSIKAAPALGVPYGNDLQFPGVSGKWYLYVCHDESWYQLKHGLQVWAIKVWFNVSYLSTREGIDGSSNAQEEMVIRQVWEKSEFVTRGPSKLAKQSNNRKTVAHIIIPGEIIRFNHATNLAWQYIVYIWLWPTLHIGHIMILPFQAQICCPGHHGWPQCSSTARASNRRAWAVSRRTSC